MSLYSLLLYNPRLRARKIFLPGFSTIVNIPFCYLPVVANVCSTVTWPPKQYWMNSTNWDCPDAYLLRNYFISATVSINFSYKFSLSFIIIVKTKIVTYTNWCHLILNFPSRRAPYLGSRFISPLAAWLLWLAVSMISFNYSSQVTA
jgi:hypothetical protein